MKILVINAGSSSIKYQLYDMPQESVLAKGAVERIGEDEARLVHYYNGKEHCRQQAIPDHEVGMEMILQVLMDKDVGAVGDISEIAAVGHRVVHGGEKFTGSIRIDEEVMASIEEFADLAPLHNPPNLTGIRAATAKLSHVPQIACFDTAFHTTMPPIAYIYPLPYELYEKYRVRRYGFHGSSHRYVSNRAAEILGKDKGQINVISCHLGNGCSLAAVRGGRSVDTSMGLTPLEGVVMGTRSGDIDPAILFYLIRKGYTPDELKEMCNKQSGLLGISGQSNDMRDLSELASGGDRRAKLAIEIFCYRIRKYIGAYTAVLGTLDAIIFTGGIGENNTSVRAAICSELKQIGVSLNAANNESAQGQEICISARDSRVSVLVIPTDEELVIARDTYQIAQ